MLAGTCGAQAQILSGPFVGDLGWKVLRDRLDLVAPSPAQLEDIAQIHNQYLAGMKQVRTEQIDPFLDDTNGMGSLTASDPEKARSGLAKTDRIRRLIAEQDAILMDRIAAVLGDTQQAPLERIREHRTRERLRHRAMDIIGGSSLPQAEPRFAIDWRSLSDAQRADIEAMLTPWEDRYTSGLKTLGAARSKALIEFSETLAELNAAQAEYGDVPPDPAEMSRLINLFRDGQRNAQELTEPATLSLQRHIASGLRALVPLLPSDQRIRVIRASASEAALSDRVTPMARRAKRMDLPPDVHTEIDRIVAFWNDDATDLLIDALEAYWKDTAEQQNVATEVDDDGNVTFDLPGSDHFVDALEAWNSRANESIDAIMALVPSELARELQNEGGSNESQETIISSTTVVMSTGDSDEGAPVVVASETSSDGGYADLFAGHNALPAISQSLIDGLARDLALTESGSQTLGKLFEAHDTARSEMESVRAAEKEAQKDAFRESMADMNDADRMAFAIDMMAPISREGLDELDDAFFAGVAELGDADAIEPWRLSRTRQLLQDAGGMSRSLQLIGVPDNRARVDLLGLVDQASLNDAEYAAARQALSKWHGPATALMTDIQDKTLRLDQAMQSMMSQAQGGGSMSIDVNAAMEVQQVRTDLAKKRGELAVFTQDTARTIESVIASPATFHRLWLLEAHPDVANTDHFADIYDRALRIDSLTDDQRATIAAARIEHDDAWWTATEEAIAAIEAKEDPPANEQEAFFAAQRIRQDIQQQMFARREAALKRLESVRGLLTEKQLAAAGGLPDPAAPRTAEVPF